jgi:hypothetical protein
MSVLFDRFGLSGWRTLLAAALVILPALVALPSFASAQGTKPASSGIVSVTLDQAQVMKLPDGVVTLVVGNPLIADVSIQAGGMVVLTGKGYGVTNLVALDRSGSVLEQKTIQVQGSRDSVVVYRGTERESYSCTPKCERRITLGDGAEFFNATIGQAGMRTGQAQQGGVQNK